MKKAYIFLSVLLFIMGGSAMGADSTFVDRNTLYKSVTYFNESEYLSGKIAQDTVENSLHLFHQYNPAITSIHPYSYLGNLGAPYKSMFYENNTRTGIVTGLPDYTLYQSDNSSIRYYNAKKRYSNLRYVLGAHLEQRFNLSHAQNINPFWNVALDFQRISSDGAYTNLSSEYGNVTVALNGRSKNERYLILSNFIYNRTDIGQNGGLSRDPAFEHASNVDGLLYPVNLKDAHTQAKTKSIYIRQQYNFGYFNEKKVNDSTSTKTFQPSWGLFHALQIEDKSKTYKEQSESLFYPNSYFFTNYTNDSIFTRKIENKIGLYTNEHQKRNPEQLRKVNAFVNFENQLVLFKQKSTDGTKDYASLDTLLRSNLLRAAAFSSVKNALSWNVNGTYNVMGTNQSDYSINGFLILKPMAPFPGKGFFKLEGANQKQSPAFIYNKMLSNHFIWNNQFARASLSAIKLSYQNPLHRFDISYNASFVKNYLFFGVDGLPHNHFHTFTIHSVMLHKDFKAGHFYLTNRFFYQLVQKAGNDVINLPSVISLNSIYYENNYFAKSLLLQLGFDVRYNSKYYADTYMPSTGRFFVQNGQLTGDQVYLDFFVNMQIKTARIFIKAENLNAPTSGYTSNMSPFYPIPGRAFKFGISWQFYD